jgi:hypothetical protein
MKTNIEEVLLHPTHNRFFITGEHPEGQLEHIGDAIGRDTIIVKWVNGWTRMYKNDGQRNEDWYGWRQDVLAPYDGIVESVRENTKVNQPGEHQADKAGCITFLRNDGVRVAYGHVMDVIVNEGDTVKAGQAVAKVGNNGTSWNPHIHIGAWHGQTPLQIRFDLEAMGKLMKENPDVFYCEDL